MACLWPSGVYLARGISCIDGVGTMTPELNPRHAEIARIARERIQKMLGKKITETIEEKK